jgi:ATP-binding cassette, subfamily B, bacterial PglK
MYQIFKNCLKLISKQNVRNTFFIVVANQVGSLLEVLGLGLIPILAINILNKNRILEFFEEKNIEFLSEYIYMENFVLFSFAFLLLFFVFKNLYLFFISYLQGKLRVNIFNDLSKKFFQLYIFSPYRYFLKKNPSYLISVMTNEIQGACIVLEYFVQLIRNLFLVIFVSIVLLLIDTKLSFFLISFIFLLVLFFQSSIRKFTELRGKVLQEARAENIQLINQSFDIIKDAKLSRKENFFINIIKEQLDKMGKVKVQSAILMALPRPVLETLVLFIIALILSYASIVENNLTTAIPFITFLAVASMKLIPAIKVSSNAISTININKVSLDIVIKEIEEMSKNKENYDKNKINNKSDKPLNRNFKTIEVNNLNFKYNEKVNILNDISFKINKGEKIGIVGSSGSGKSTLINLILGLLNADKGIISLDGENIFNNINSWYDLLGYVPQDVYLLDDTIKNNIALGENENANDQKSSILKSIKISNSDIFINDLPAGLETNVGNRGTSLSGGQKQRIGIARAIYRKPEILILDEATNSLDKENEKQITSKILDLKDITVIIVAHNMSSLEKCDKLILLEKGSIKEIGNYSTIMSKYNLN